MSRADLAAGREVRSGRTTTVQSFSKNDGVDCTFSYLSSGMFLTFALAVAALSMSVLAFQREDPIVCVPMKSNLTYTIQAHDATVREFMHVELADDSVKLTCGGTAMTHFYRKFRDEINPHMALHCGRDTMLFWAAFIPHFSFPDPSGSGRMATHTMEFSGDDLGEDVCYQKRFPSSSLPHLFL